MFWLLKLALQSNQTTSFTRGGDGTNVELSMLTDMTNVPKINHPIMNDVVTYNMMWQY
jgi:hypothetical protein